MAEKEQGSSAGSGDGGATGAQCAMRLRQIQRELKELNRDLIASAKKKHAEGKPLSRDEKRVVKKHGELTTENAFWTLARDLPKHLYVAMSGRQTKILHDQAIRLGIPLKADRIDLAAVLEWVHKAIADGRFRGVDGEEDMPTGDTAAAERWRSIKADIEEIKLMELRKQIVSMDAALRWAGQMSALLRGLGDDFQRDGHAECFRKLSETIDDIDRVAEKFFAAEPDNGQVKQPGEVSQAGT